MSDDLQLPEVPEAKPEDPEDVSWALSTAEAMWARGDHSEGIKWVRRAAEAASEAEDDGRALELAKAAADLTNLINRKASRASIDIEEIDPMSEPAPPPVPPARAGAAAKPSPPKPLGAISPRPLPTSVTRQVTTPSRPPAPLPSRTSHPPPAAGSRPSSPPGGRASTKPLGTNTKPASLRPGSIAPKPGEKKDGTKKSSRRSRDNFDTELGGAAGARAVGVADTAPQPAVDDKTATLLTSDTAETAAIEVPVQRSRPEIGNNEPTLVGHVNDLVKPTGRSTDEWDASPTQNLAGEDMTFMIEGERKTEVGPAADFKTTMQSFPRPGEKASAPSGTNPPATVAGVMLTQQAFAPSANAPQLSSAGPRPAAGERHDPGIMTSQAVRVVVWRDASGVHVAPAGTVVSAITVDAVLVALEPNADLTAWLSARDQKPR